MINETDAIGTSLANGTTNDTVLLECGEVVTQCGCYDAEYARISETLQVILKASKNLQTLKYLKVIERVYIDIYIIFCSGGVKECFSSESV